MIDWIEVTDSSRVSAVAYDSENETIYVRFKKDGVEWWYGNCPAFIWEQFTMPGVSKGSFIHTQLDNHPNGRHV
jgi:hypothetical protein